jgi:hypothetical protein
VRDADIHKTTFLTLGVLVEWVAMPFGMSNAQAAFERMVSDIMREFLHKLHRLPIVHFVARLNPIADYRVSIRIGNSVPELQAFAYNPNILER